ncbi:MAG: hypothetical protein QXT90_00915 [Candidatus Caldarchaeum sp.]
MEPKPYAIVLQHDRYRRGCLNLIASEKVLSPATKRALASDMASRYGFRPEFYSGTGKINEIWMLAEELGKQVFKAEHVNVTPLSGHVALMTCLYVLCGKGGKIACVDPSAGGYPGLLPDKIPEIYGCRVVNIPYADVQVDTEEALNILSKEKPDVVVLGASLFLYPMPVREVSEFVHSYGGRVVYDGSHVLGLIAGGVFQKPLEEGADVLLGSTHKSFFGPQGGIILTNDEKIAKQVEASTFHKFVDNIHFNRVAALAVALDEMKRNGLRYAEKVVSNSAELARSLENNGFNPFKTVHGYTKSHQVYLSFKEDEAVKVRDVLERSRILVDMGVRVGTAEVTRRGMGLKQMSAIAKLFRRALNGEKVAAEAQSLALRFIDVKFT